MLAGPCLPATLAWVARHESIGAAVQLSTLEALCMKECWLGSGCAVQDGCLPQIPLMGVSNRNMLAEDKAWEEQGRQEAAELQAAMQASGGLWGPEQVGV